MIWNALFLCAIASASLISKDKKYSISWKVKDEAIHFTVEAQRDTFKNNWLALAFLDAGQSRSMTNVDMIFLHSESDLCILEDRWSVTSQDGAPRSDSDQGGSDDVVHEESFVFGESASCTFSRLLDTGDRFDFAIRNETINFFWASGAIRDKQYVKHHKSVEGRKVNMLLEQSYDQGRDPDTAYPDQNDYMQKKVKVVANWKVFWHAVLMLVAFVILMVPFSGLARYMKNIYPGWFFAHWKGQVAAVLIAAFATILVYWHLKWNFRQDKHSILGALIMFGLLPLQVLLGYLSNKLWYEGKCPHWFPDKMHWITAYAILIGSVVNIGFGIEWYLTIAPLFLSSNYIEASESMQSSDNVWLCFGILCAILLIGFGLFESFAGQVHEHEREADTATLNHSQVYDSTVQVNEEEEALLVNKTATSIEVNQRPLNGPRSFVWSSKFTRSFFISWWVVLAALTVTISVLLLVV